MTIRRLYPSFGRGVLFARPVQGRAHTRKFRPILLCLPVFMALCGCAHSPAGAVGVTQDSSAIVNPASELAEPMPDDRIVYKSTATRELHLNIFTPDAVVYPGARPAVLFFHGGGWQTGNPSQFYDQAAHLANLGLVAISVEYRLKSVDGTAPDIALMDAGSAIRYVRAHSGRLGVDPDRIAAAGGSAGGHLAAALAAVDGFDDPADDVSVSKRPGGLILYNSVIDNSPEGYGYDRVARYWEKFSPLHNIRKGHPPAVFLLGTKDELIPVATGEAYCARLKAIGSACTLRLFPGKKHAFFNRKAPAQIRRETLDAQDQFLRSIGYLDGE